jgi:tetratricopeptide (TPR) repeat protein
LEAWRTFIFRVAVYSALLFLILLTASLRFHQRPATAPEESGHAVRPNDVARFTPPSSPPAHIQGNPVEPPQTIPVPAPSIGSQPQPTANEPSRTGSRAIEKFRKGDYESAIKLFRELAETDKGAFTGVGMSYFKLGNYASAVECLEKALDHNGNDFSAQKALAFSYYKMDKLEESLEHAGKGLALYPDPELRTLVDRLKREIKTQSTYVEESTTHFKVLFDGYEHGQIDREVTSILEDAYRFVGKEFDHFPAGVVTVILYTNSDFHDTTQAPHWSGGQYDGKIRIPVRGAERQSEILKKVLFHEYTHAVVHSITPQCPRWIDEGLAEYFSTSYPRMIGQLIPLRRIEDSFSGLSDRNVGVAYQESYSAVSYLIETYGLYRIKEMLESLSKGTDINQAFKDAFSKTYADFISEWGR